MRPLIVVVGGVRGQHGPQMPFPEDQHSVGAFGSHCAYPPLGKGVRSRRPGRDLDHLDAVVRQDVIEDLGELRVPVTDQKSDRGRTVAQVDDLGHPEKLSESFTLSGLWLNT